MPAAPDSSGSGFIPAVDLTSQVLPALTGSSKYGGVMLWSKLYDDETGYSQYIKRHVQTLNNFFLISTEHEIKCMILRCPLLSIRIIKILSKKCNDSLIEILVANSLVNES